MNTDERSIGSVHLSVYLWLIMARYRMTSFHFSAVASDGQIRTGAIHAESERLVAYELRRQGLTPVYVGKEAKKSVDIKLPSFSGGRKRDVLFFTQELSTLLSAGVPLDRALSITAELTDRPTFRALVQDILRVLKGGRTLADSLASHPNHFSELYINMVRAGEAGGSLAVVFERLSEFERTRDDLRSYILSSMAYPTLLSLVGIGSILVLMNFVVPRFAVGLRRIAHRDAAAHQNAAGRQQVSAKLRLARNHAAGAIRDRHVYLCAHHAGTAVVGHAAAENSGARRRAAQGRNGALRPRHGHAGVEQRAAGAIACHRRRDAEQSQDRGIARKRVPGREARRRHRRRPCESAGQFPPLAAHLLSVGEETGRLDSMFVRMADIYDADTRASIRRFTSLFEPLVILVMGLVVGTLILSMLLAIVGMNDVAM